MKFFDRNKNENIFANLLKVCTAMAVCVFFAACGGDSGNSGESNSDDTLQAESDDEPKTDSIPSYESENDLPNCTMPPIRSKIRKIFANIRKNYF